MSINLKNILTLSHEKVMDFFLKSEQFHGFELPEYFNFDKVLKAVAKSVGNKSYDECLSNVSLSPPPSPA